MAKVKITGHASGSGVLTVTAPNTSTDRTITLPDATATIATTAATDALTATTNTLTTRVNGASGKKNLIINGAMQVAQRGASKSGYTAGGYHTCDRWIHDKAAATGTFTMTQEADAPVGFKNSLKVNCTTVGSSGSYNAIQTRLESQDTAHLAYGTSSAKAVTLSFWVKVSQTGNQQMNLIHHADAGSRQISFVYTINQANTWEKKTVTFPGDTARVGDDDTTVGFYLEWFLSSYSGRTGSAVLTSWGSYTNAARFEGATISIGDSTSDTWQITGVQLEEGSVATEFEGRSYGEELTLCERYYETSMTHGDLSQYQGQQPVPGLASATYGATASSAGGRQFRTWKRATPTVTIYHQDGTSGGVYLIHNAAKITGVSASHINQNGFLFVTKSSGFNSGYYYYYGITVDAEL